MRSANSPASSSHNYLHVAWCGDTQCILVKQSGRVAFVSGAHKPNSELEKRRIEASGGSVSFQSSAWRVNGSLAVARSFGDVDYQSCGVTCEPDVRSIALDGTEDFLVIGCDGLWEGLVGEEDMIGGGGSGSGGSTLPSSSSSSSSANKHQWVSWVYDEVHRSSASTSVNPAEMLVRKAKENGSSDNITAVFICLRDSLAQISKPVDGNV